MLAHSSMTMQESRICRSTLEEHKRKLQGVSCDLSTLLFTDAEPSVCFVKHRECHPSCSGGVGVKLRDGLAVQTIQVRGDSKVINAGRAKDV